MPITTTGGHGHFFGLRADTEAEVRTAVRSLVEDDVDFIKVMATGGRLTPNSAMLGAQYTRSELAAIAEEATRLNRPVAAHVLSSEGIRRCLDAGVRTLEHCMWHDASGRYVIDDEALERIRRDGTFVSLTIVGTMRNAIMAATSQAARALGIEDAVVQRGRLQVEDGRIATAPSQSQYERPAPTVRRSRHAR